MSVCVSARFSGKLDILGPSLRWTFLYVCILYIFSRRSFRKTTKGRNVKIRDGNPKSESDQLFGPRKNPNPKFQLPILIVNFTTFVAFKKRQKCKSESDQFF